MKLHLSLAGLLLLNSGFALANQDSLPNNPHKLTYESPQVCVELGSPKSGFIKNFISDAERALRVAKDQKRSYKSKVIYIANTLKIKQKLLWSQSGVKQAQQELRAKTQEIIAKKEQDLKVKALNPANQDYKQRNACGGYYSRVKERVMYHNVVEDIYAVMLPQAIEQEKLAKQQRAKAQAEEKAKAEKAAKEQAIREEKRQEQQKAKQQKQALQQEKTALVREFNAHKPNKILVTVIRKDGNGNIEAYASEHGSFILLDPKGQVKSAGAIWLELAKNSLTFSRKDANGFTQTIESYTITDKGSKAFTQWSKSAEAKSLLEDIAALDAKIAQLAQK